jgi:hypothetical protein
LGVGKPTFTGVHYTHFLSMTKFTIEELGFHPKSIDPISQLIP